jgi:hypothetical protein
VTANCGIVGRQLLVWQEKAGGMLEQFSKVMLVFAVLKVPKHHLLLS